MRPAIDKPTIYLITKGEATPANFPEKRAEILDIIRIAAESGVSFVQLRERQLSARLVYELAVEAAAITRPTATKLLINDRPDIAAAASAGGVHLTANSLNAAIVRKTFSPEMIIGVSAHSTDEVERAAAARADFALFGPVFETPGKTTTQGLAALREACGVVRHFPVLAIGGISAENAESALDAGAGGVAAIRSLGSREGMQAMISAITDAR